MTAICRAQLSADRPPLFGRVMPGWSASAWATDCRRRAWLCWKVQPGIAETWLEWAFTVELSR